MLLVGQLVPPSGAVTLGGEGAVKGAVVTAMRAVVKGGGGALESISSRMRSLQTSVKEGTDSSA